MFTVANIRYLPNIDWQLPHVSDTPSALHADLDLCTPLSWPSELPSQLPVGLSVLDDKHLECLAKFEFQISNEWF